MRLVSFLSTSLARILFPARCLGCGRYDTWLCSSCIDVLPSLSPECAVCREQSSGWKTHPHCRHKTRLKQLIVGTTYTNPLLQSLIHQIKYGFVEHAASAAASIPLRSLKAISLRQETVLVPIPLHRRRLKTRGFNQSALLADQLSRSLHFPVKQILKRRKPTITQTALDHRDREANVRGAFLAVSSQWRDRPILLVDDVATTGSTLNEAAHALHGAGYHEVSAVVVARGELQTTLTEGGKMV